MAKEKTTPKCSAAELKILGDYWTLEIIQALSAGGLRFGQIQKQISHVNPATLTNRLKKLTTQHLVDRTEETVDKQSVVYSLTKKGRGVLPILREITVFAQTYMD